MEQEDAKTLGALRLRFDRRRPVPLECQGTMLECGYRIDLVVEDALVVEIKCVDRVLPIHQAQRPTYLRLTRLRAGLLVNFRETVLKDGLRRLTLSPSFPSSRLPVQSPKPR
ncbi:MAG: GxxExxY protein [Deltaproteobacteria bacterium]